MRYSKQTDQYTIRLKVKQRLASERDKTVTDSQSVRQTDRQTDRQIDR